MLSALVVAMALQAAAPTPPMTLEHTPVGSCALGEPFIVGARIVSASGRRVFEPAVFVRAVGAKEYQRLPMTPGGAVDTFIARVPGEMTRHDLEYFIETFDEDGKGPFRKGSPESPLKLQALAAPPPVAPPPPPLSTSGAKAAPEVVVVAAPAAKVSQQASVRENPLKSGRAIAGWATLGVGVAALAGWGVVGGLCLQDYESQKTAAANGDLAAWQAAKDATHAKALVADVLMPAGIAVTAVGIGLVVWGALSGSPEGVKVGLAPAPGGGAAFVSGRF
jgi:hypothetical protein